MKRRRNLVLAALLALASLSMSSCSIGSGGSPGDRLIADLAVTKTHVIIKNGGSKVWKDALLVIDGAYKLRKDYVPRGNSAFPYSSFVDDQGRPFEPGRLKLRRLHIETAMPGGKFDW